MNFVHNFVKFVFLATYSIQPVWLAIQSELKGLLYAYGTFIENRVNLSNAVTSMSDSFQTRRRSKVQPVKFNKVNNLKIFINIVFF